MEVKNREIHPLTFKEANLFKRVQRHESRHNKIIFHAEARWLSRGNVLECVFQLWQELRDFLTQQGYSISTNFQGNVWLYLNLNSLSWIVQPFAYEEIDMGFAHLAATTQKTAQITQKLKKVNLPAHEVCTTPTINKTRNNLIYCDCSAGIHPPAVKNVIITLFLGRFS